MNISIIVLAAGLGKRMANPDLPKVLVKFNNKPLLFYVLKSAVALAPHRICIVVGHKKELISNYVFSAFRLHCPDVPMDKFVFAEQKEQIGTADAVNSARPFFMEEQQDILILSGDVPMLTSDTLLKFSELHRADNSDISVLTADAPNPMGYGRIVRDSEEHFLRIVEEKDATEDERNIVEINSGVYLLDSHLLFSLLNQVDNKNQQGEYYLTDIIGIAAGQDKKVSAYNIARFDEIQGVNTPEQLQGLKFDDV
ncbi:MAG: NTP transferase domain-containing protein [Ignavibacteria bacterium]|jgi:UDP-N-acetylglucosamine diphosphorylase/glucosamine-1-phosphate N-acetyltransferase|nr:NTP transferase domain-containing protein [Ignavibacteria bacterium]